MRGDEIEAGRNYGQLMACLMRERDRFATDHDFHAFALESVRRFIVDLRSLDIELTMRPRYLLSERRGASGESGALPEA